MSLIVIVMAVALFVLESKLLTTAAVLFTLVLLIPSLIVDLLVLFGPKSDEHGDPLGQYRSSARRRK